jgi:hypothetical protein
MGRLVICLPICLLLAPRNPGLDQLPEEAPVPIRGERPVSTELIAILGAQPQAGFPAGIPWVSLVDLARYRETPKEAVALLAFAPAPAFPGAVNWAALDLAGRRAAVPESARPDGDPVRFLAACLQRYDREVRGYTLTMRKTERVNGKVKPTEVVDVAFRERPFSVYFHWKEGAGLARRTLYVQGENDDKMLALTGFGIQPLDPNSPLVKSSSRYPITEFGFKVATERVYRGWKEAQAEGTLHVEYLGLRKVAEVGDRMCHVLHRTRYAKVPEDGVTDLTLYIDRDTWLQVGSVLRDSNKQLVGEYYFRDVRLNPDFPDWQFTRAALEKK